MPTKKRRLEALYESEANMEGGGFFQNLLKRVFIGVSDMIVRPTGFVPSQIKYGWLNRPIDMPPLEDLAKMVASTYNPEGSNDPAIQGYTRVLKTPTLTVFRVNRKRNIFIYALRGTAFTDINDITADLGIVRSIVEDASTARNVRNSSRYANDVADIKEFDGLVKDYFRVDNPIYYGVGHSLSGAIIDELLEDGYISSAVSFNPAIERKDFNSPNDNHRIYLECDVLYNLLGKYITNGNLEVIPMKNPRGEDAGTIDTTKGSIECHNIKTVIPLMSGKGINNNVGLMYKPPMDFFEKRETYPECEEILRRPVTQDVGINSGRERARRAYDECVARKGVKKPEKSICDDPRYIGMECKNRRPTFQDLINGRSRPDFRPIGSGLFDTIVGNLGKSLAEQSSQGNILGRIKDSIDKGAALRKAEQDKEWSGGLLGKIGIPNPMKLFGGNQEMEGEGVMGDLWRSGAKTIREYSGMKEPEVVSTPLFDYTDRDAVEDRFYGERSNAPSKVGRHLKMFGRGRPYTAAEWEAKLCKGEDSLLAKKKRAIAARAEKGVPDLEAPMRTSRVIKATPPKEKVREKYYFIFRGNPSRMYEGDGDVFIMTPDQLLAPDFRHRLVQTIDNNNREKQKENKSRKGTMASQLQKNKPSANLTTADAVAKSAQETFKDQSTLYNFKMGYEYTVDTLKRFAKKVSADEYAKLKREGRIEDTDLWDARA